MENVLPCFKHNVAAILQNEAMFRNLVLKNGLIVVNKNLRAQESSIYVHITIVFEYISTTDLV